MVMSLREFVSNTFKIKCKPHFLLPTILHLSYLCNRDVECLFGIRVSSFVCHVSITLVLRHRDDLHNIFPSSHPLHSHSPFPLFSSSFLPSQFPFSLHFTDLNPILSPPLTLHYTAPNTTISSPHFFFLPLFLSFFLSLLLSFFLSFFLPSSLSFFLPFISSFFLSLLLSYFLSSFPSFFLSFYRTVTRCSSHISSHH